MKKRIKKEHLHIGTLTLGVFVIVSVMAITFLPHTAPQASATPVFFQPEAQMLTQAVDANHVAVTGATFPTPSELPDVVSNPTSTPYAYDANTCTAASDEYGCLVDYYKSTVSNYGVATAIADIKERYNTNAVIISECHPIMHIIGQMASRIYPTVSDAYLHGDNFCWSGYYHGVLEGVVMKIGKANLPAQLNTICADIPGKATYNFDYYNCVHGLGHGIMELKEDDVPASLAQCDDLTGDWEQQSCYSGVFMENIISELHDGTSTWLKPSDPLFPCDAIADKYQYQCYLGQTSYALEITGYNFQRIFDLCATVAEPYRDVCNQSMGRDVANQKLHQAQDTKDTCALADTPNDFTNCVIGAAKEMISYYHTDVQAKTFCNLLDSANKSVCLDTTANYYSAFK